MLSRSGLYALQAALYLAQEDSGRPVSAARMASDLEVPAEYLAKVLRRLKGEGVLSSTRGTRGGYTLTGSADEFTVEDVVRPFEQVRPLRRCLLGGACDLANPCAAHLRRLEWNEARIRIFRATWLKDLLPVAAAAVGVSPEASSSDPNRGNEKRCVP
jgi:Rrf2 family protein